MRISDWSSDVCSSDLSPCVPAWSGVTIAPTLTGQPSPITAWRWSAKGGPPGHTGTAAWSGCEMSHIRLIRPPLGQNPHPNNHPDRTSDGSGQSVYDSVGLGGCRNIKKNKLKA